MIGNLKCLPDLFPRKVAEVGEVLKDLMMVIPQQPLDDYLIEEEANFVSVAECFAVDSVELVG